MFSLKCVYTHILIVIKLKELIFVIYTIMLQTGNVHLLEMRLLETGFLSRFQNKKSRF
jgi:hypothetical protein